MRMPISRVRSVTDTSMMFMMPTPPTSSEMPAIAESISVIVPVMMPSDVGDLGRVLHVEVGRLAGVDAVPLQQQLADLALGVGHQLARCGPSTMIASTLSNFEPCSRFCTVVYGIRTMSSWSSPTMLAPLRSSTPMTRNGMFLMRIVWSSGLVVWNSLATSVWPMTQTLAAEVTSRSVKKPPACERPVADDEVVGADAEHLLRLPVGVAVDDLAAGARPAATAARTAGHSVGDGVGVGRRSASARRLSRTPPLLAAAGKDDDDVGAEALELALHQRAGALADRHHGRDRGDADDHAEHGQAGAQLVLGQGAQGDAEGEEEVHGPSALTPASRRQLFG